MSDWDDFEDEAKAGSGFNFSICGMGSLLKTLNEDARASIENAMARPDITASSIHKALKRRVDTDVSQYTVRRHRKGDCNCAKNGQ